MNIYESIVKIMGELGAIGKDKTNLQQGFKYRGIDDVMNALNPLLAKHKVFVIPEVLEHIREDRQSNKGNTLLYSICRIKYTFYAEDGTSVYAVVIGEGMDSGDKATNKAMAIAFKYACFQTFCIATEDIKDPDEETHEVKKKEQPKGSGSVSGGMISPTAHVPIKSISLCADCSTPDKPIELSKAEATYCNSFPDKFQHKLLCQNCQKKYK